jgi:hypothetical protein
MVYFLGNLESIEYYQILKKEKKGNYNFFYLIFYLNTNNISSWREHLLLIYLQQ